MNPDINKGGTSFAFQPSGCTAALPARASAALVLALDNVVPIPDGSVLYTCQVAIAQRRRRRALRADRTATPAPAIPTGNALDHHRRQRQRSIVDGGAPTPGARRSSIGSADRRYGRRVTRRRLPRRPTLRSPAPRTTSPSRRRSPIAAKANGKPDCAVNAGHQQGRHVVRLPALGLHGRAPTAPASRCAGRWRSTNVAPIPTGSVLYTCQVQIADDAADGDHPLTCSNAGRERSGRRRGRRRPAPTARSPWAAVAVPTSTPTETPTASGTPTNTPARRYADQHPGRCDADPHGTRPDRPTRCSNDDDGCAIVSPAQSQAGLDAAAARRRAALAAPPFALRRG